MVRITSLIAFAIVLTTDLLYITVINAQGESNQPYVPRFFGSYLAVMAAIIAASLVPRPEMAVIRVPLRAAVASGLLVAGLIGAFSIGLPLVVAGILITVASTRTARKSSSWWWRLSPLFAVVLAVAVLVAGLDVTQRLIVCPETGTSSGSGSGLVAGPYHYECNNGQLHWSGN